MRETSTTKTIVQSIAHFQSLFGCKGFKTRISATEAEN
jgi:hypothetical protein